MKLYAHHLCPFSRRVRIALAELEVEHEFVEHGPEAPHPEELRGKVPADRGVPVLFVSVLPDHLVLWDSAAIMFWLDAMQPRSLTPSARDPQAIARCWVGWAATTLYPVLHRMETSQGSEEELVSALRAIEPFLVGPWLVASEFTIADASLAPAVAMLSTKAIEKLPENVRAYVARLRSRPSVRDVCGLDAIENPSSPSNTSKGPSKAA